MAETTTPTIVNEITHVRTGPFAVNYYSPDFSGGNLAAELIAAPTRTNSATYITHITMGIVEDTSDIVVDANISIVDGVGDTVFGPAQFQANGQTIFSKDFTKPLKITDNKAVDVWGQGENGSYQAACWVYVEYCTGDNPLT